MSKLAQAGDKQHRVAPMRQAARRLDRVFQRVGGNDRQVDARQCLADFWAVAADQNNRTRILRYGLLQRREILAFAISPQDHHHLASHPEQRRFGRAHVGALGVVVIAYAVDVRHPFNPVRQSTEMTQALQGLRFRHADGGGEAEGSQRVCDIVQAGNRHLAERHQLPRVLTQFALAQAKMRFCHRTVDAKGHDRSIRPGHGQHPRIFPVKDLDPAAREYSRLGRRIGFHVRIAVQVIFTDIEDRRCIGV